MSLGSREQQLLDRKNTNSDPYGSQPYFQQVTYVWWAPQLSSTYRKYTLLLHNPLHEHPLHNFNFQNVFNVKKYILLQTHYNCSCSISRGDKGGGWEEGRAPLPTGLLLEYHCSCTTWSHIELPVIQKTNTLTHS